MFQKIVFALAPVVLWGSVAAQLTGATGQVQAAAQDEQGVRELMAHWNNAYHGLDAKALATLETDDFQMVDRFGEWYDSRGAAENERLWDWSFKNIYRGKPGPERTIENVRFLRPEVAVVAAKCHWGEIVLDDGGHIPPHGEIDTFVLVKQGDQWKIAQLDIANQMQSTRPGEHTDIPHK
jgi:uncharacterized protein (TIGR02246 family)